jgi:NAD(P)H-dependent FMN reductase
MRVTRIGMDAPPAAQALLEAIATAHGMVWSSPQYTAR